MKEAMQYRAAGLSVLPAVRLRKHPAVSGWKMFQTRLPSEEEMNSWFGRGAEAVCIVCGKVSGNVEIIDFDNHGELFLKWAEALPQDLYDRLVIEQTPSGGFHAAYRCGEEVCGNVKLATGIREGKKTTLIETRGEGGLVLCAPTPGYRLRQGSYTALPVLAPGERETLLMAAWALDETPSVREPEDEAPQGETEFEVRPGDDFNRRGDVRALLLDHGWKFLRRSSDGNEHWQRPGKKGDQNSATLKDGSFYVFSSNASPFEPEKCYSPFTVYALLEHGGDYTGAAAALLEQGYGRPEKPPDIDFGTLLRNSGAVQPAAAAESSPAKDDTAPDMSEEELRETLVETLPFPERLYHFPGLVGDIMATTLKYASTPNRPLALSGALAMMSFLTARKVKTPSGLRSNVYLLALAISGSGKERPRDINQIISEKTGISRGLIDGVASGAGLEDMLTVTPALLWQCDEFYATLDEMLREGPEGNNTVMEKLLKMYTSSHKAYSTRAKAGKAPSIISCPHVTLYATTTPKGFFDHVNERFLADGMYARLSLMVAEKPGEGHLPEEPSVSPEVIGKALKWAQFRPPGSGNTDIAPLAVPYTADAAPMAEELFRKQQRMLAEMHEAGEPEWKCSVWNRYCEISLRYALIYACSVADRPELTVITPDAIRWGGDFVSWEMSNKIYMTGRNYFKTDFSRLTDLALKGLRRWHKENGLGTPMPGWRFNRLLDGYPPNIIRAVAESLQEQEKMFAKPSGRGFRYSLKRLQ